MIDCALLDIGIPNIQSSSQISRNRYKYHDGGVNAQRKKKRMATTDPDEKVIFLVRHAQSLQNVATARFFSTGDAKALGTILRLGYDAPLSDEGKEQLRKAATSLETSKFTSNHQIELVAHSPYQRALATAQALFPSFVGSSRMQLLPNLHERTLPEYFFSFWMDSRIDDVKRWLDGRSERVIALVGHGQFFKRCLESHAVQPNVSIVECRYSPRSGFVPIAEQSKAMVFDGFADPKGTQGRPQHDPEPWQDP